MHKSAAFRPVGLLVLTAVVVILAVPGVRSQDTPLPIYGYVRGPDGAVVEGARITITGSDGQGKVSFTDEPTLVTDEQGRYYVDVNYNNGTLSGLSPGDPVQVAAVTGDLSASRTVVLTQTSTQADLLLEERTETVADPGRPWYFYAVWVTVVLAVLGILLYFFVPADEQR